MAGRTARTSGLVLLVIVLAAVAAVAGFVVTRHLHPDTSTTRAAAGAGGPLPAVASSALTEPTATAPAPAAVDRAAVQAAFGPALRDPGLGPGALASVVDVRTGAVLLDRSAATTAAPASTTKIVTAAALLAVRKPGDTITTSAVTDGRGTVVLVGGGDPTLSAAPSGTSPRYPGAARLADLAAQVRRAGVPVTRIVVGGRFSGPAVSPDWAPEDVPSEYASAITALMTDGGRAAPGDELRSANPDLDAGRSFAALLGRSGTPVARGSAASGMRTIGTVSSAPLATLVEQMLVDSDDVIAECLARQVALAEGGPASYAGAAAAMRRALRPLGLDIGAGLRDGSGLAPGDRLAPGVLTRLLRIIAAGGPPGVRDIGAALPVAGWSGTLAARFADGSSRAGAGIVRAKTGTLTGVSTLAGLVHTRRGGLVAFAVFADRNTSTPAAQAALDAAVTRLATCSC